MLMLAGCGADATGSTTVSTTTVPTTKPVLKGWQENGGNRYFYGDDGVMHTGWLEMAGVKYYFDEDGIMQTGLTIIDRKIYYFNDAGCCCAGWVEIEGIPHYFGSDGVLGAGWLEEDGTKCYLVDGRKATGWQDIEADRYYFDAEGVPVSGWQEIDGTRYYFREDGRMARGKVVFSEDETRYFTSAGKEVILVNPWNYVPEYYNPTIVPYGKYKVAEECLAALEQMMADCEAAGNKPMVRSAYRTYSDQKWLYNRRVQIFLSQGYSQADAERIAATINAIPGTSEHQLGLAVDIVDESYQILDEQQETTPSQIWLMEHCWEYGFILRYPNGKTDVTGIIYEPWHYRYVGVELAMEMKDSGLCLEEYLEQLTQE